MTPIPFIMIGGLLAILIWSTKQAHDRAKFQLDQFYERCKDQILAEKKSVACSTYTVGLKNSRYLFRRCDLIFLEKGLVILPFYRIGKYKVMDYPMSISDNSLTAIGALKKFDLNSDSGNVFFEFGEAGFTTTCVGITLKGLTPEEKELIKVLTFQK
ncbi:hypothetical protein [Flavobacterium sp.]|uniref:hypothetical protein n=1 Tax=Flavobacterium sp. TaxID=239 RepID=UPI0039E5C22C